VLLFVQRMSLLLPFFGLGTISDSSLKKRRKADMDQAALTRRFVSRRAYSGKPASRNAAIKLNGANGRGSWVALETLIYRR
jgi:hypothetical protein